jgi:hypothetical protein
VTTAVAVGGARIRRQSVISVSYKVSGSGTVHSGAVIRIRSRAVIHVSYTVSEQGRVTPPRSG